MFTNRSYFDILVISLNSFGHKSVFQSWASVFFPSHRSHGSLSCTGILGKPSQHIYTFLNNLWFLTCTFRTVFLFLFKQLHSVFIFQQKKVEKHDNMDSTRPDETAQEKSQNNLVASLAEKAMSVASPVVPTKGDGEVDQERSVKY